MPDHGDGHEEGPIDFRSVERFIRRALHAGIINGGTAFRLLELARASEAAPASASARPAPPAPPPPRQEVLAAQATLQAAAAFLETPAALGLTTRAHEALSREMAWLDRALQEGNPALIAAGGPRLAGTLASARRSLGGPAPAPPVVRPAPPVTRPASPVAPPAPPSGPPAARPAPVASPRPVGPTWSQRAGRQLAAMRRAVGSDFAIHGLTYLGVLLALVVIIVFFTKGYFGTAFEWPWTRPLIFIVTPSFFFCLAWVLRHRSGIPQTAIAVEVIGAILVPAMVAALFQDGFDWPPDPGWVGRWWSYAGAGLVTLVFFWFLAKRRRMYAYLLAPTVWTIAGALGLFLDVDWLVVQTVDRGPLDMPDGMSGYQIALILGVMAVSVPVATLIRRTRVGKVASGPTVWAAIALAPFMLVIAVQFAYSDALLAAGGARPGLGQLDLPVGLAAAATGALYLAARGAGFAWAGLPEKARRGLPEAVAVLGSATLAVAVGLGLVDLVGIPWVGLILCALGTALAGVERIPGFGCRAGSWVAAAVAVSGLMMSLGDGGATLAAWGLVALALAAFPAGVRALFRTAPVAESLSRVLLWLATLVALGAGAGRLAWPEGTAWVLVGSALLLAATKRAKVLPTRVRSLAHLPAAVLAAAALGVTAARAADATGPGYAVSGALVLAAGVAVLLLDVPWTWRLLPGTALLVAGGLVEVHPALESGAWVGAAADAAVLGGVGLVLVGDALLRRSGRYGAWHAALGHALVLASLGRSLPHERSALVGLGCFFVAAAAEAAGVESGRSALASGAPRPWPTLPAIAAAGALPFLTVLASERIPTVAAEAGRRGLVLAVTALCLAAATIAWRKRGRLRAVSAVVGTAVALAGVALAAPSPTGTLLATGAAAVTTATITVGCRLAWATVLPWALGAAAFLLGLWRGGVTPLDLRYGMLGAGALLAAGPAAVNLRRGRPALRLGRWLWPPLLVGLALLPVAVGFGLARPRLLGLIALGTAAVLAFVGWCLRAGVASLPVAAAAAIGYAHLLRSPWPTFSDGVRWMPLAGALVVASALLPGRRSWRVLADPSPGALVAGLIVAGMGVGVGFDQGEAAPALLCSAGLLGVVWAARRHEAWLYASLGAALAAGLAGAPDWWWLSATAAADAVVLGILAVRRAEEEAGPLLAWGAAVLASVAFGALTEWGAWSTVPLLAASASAAAVCLVAATVLGLPREWHPGAALWQLPAAALAAGAAVTVSAQGHLRLGVGALGVDAATLAAAAVAAGLVATLRLWPGLVVGSAALAAAAYGCLAGWLGWSAPVVVGVTAAAGGVLALGAAGLSLRPGISERLALWSLPLHGLAQVAAVAVAVVALQEFAVPQGLGVVAGVLAAEAALAGVIGTAGQRLDLAAASAVFIAGAYGCLAGWLGWDASVVVGVTAAVGLVVGAAATALSYWASAPARAALWRLPLHGLAQVAAVAVAVVALQEFGVPQGLGVVAGVLAVEAALAGAVGTVESRAGLVALSALLGAGAYGCLAGWLEWGTDPLVEVTAGCAAVLGALATAVGYLPPGSRRAALWRAPLHVLAQAAVVTVGAAAVTGYEPATALWVVAAACAFEALYLAVNASQMAAEWRPRYVSSGFAIGAVFVVLAAVGRGGSEAGPWVQGSAALALVAAVGYGLAGGDRPWRGPAALFAGVVAPGAAVAATWMIGSPYAHTAGAVAFLGADLIAAGLLSRRVALIEGGLVAWVGTGLIAFNQHLDLTSHLTVVPLAVALLGVIEVERGRRRGEGREPSTAPLRLLEWALMLFPPALAIADATNDLPFLAVLAAEGAVLMGWGILSEVRRRALLGVGVLATSILLAAVIPLSRGLSGGMTGGKWLAVGAGAAVLLILAGSMLERYRRRVGQALAAVGRAIEGWE